MLRHEKKSQGEHQEPGTQAQTFTLRIWITNQEGTHLEWRGRMQHIQSGEVKYCQDWDSFIIYVEEVLCNPPSI